VDVKIINCSLHSCSCMQFREQQQCCQQEATA
jgi:hypothetical protein